MFKSFQLKSCGAGLLGYRWEAENPVAALCLLHGIGEHGGRFDRFAESLKTHGISTLSFDFRGHGGSAGKRGHTGGRKTVLRDADSLIAYARAAYGELPLVFYGHSFGGNVLLEYRLRGRLSAVPAAYIAASPWLALCRRVPAWFYRFVKALAKLRPDFALSAGINAAMLGNAQILESMRGDRLVHNKISALTAVESQDAANALMNRQIADRHGGGQKPLILMHGTADGICSIEATRAFAAAEGAHCAMIEWENYLHELHNGGPDDTGEAVQEKVAELVLGFAGKD
ncbi:MAG: lysophospholipase [Clostridiales Family XIII bacterium]|jgi:alpha-beta hydrolase superfamily lysophospholipase|nr:lysophospholipase [Clostridiales Family XIII bacterium]